MCVISIGKPLDITPQIQKSQVTQSVSVPVVNNTSVTPSVKSDSVKLNKNLKTPNAKTNLDFVSTDVNKKTVKVGSDANGLELKLSENIDTSETKIENAKLKLKASDTTSLTGNVSGELNKPKFDVKSQTDIYGIKVTTGVNNSNSATPTTKTVNKSVTKQPTKTTNDSFELGKTTGNIKTELKANESLTITTEGQIDTDKKTKLGTGAKLKITKDITAESSLNYDNGKTKAGLKSETKLATNLKVITELEHERTDFSTLKNSKSKAGIKSEFEPLKDIKLTTGTNIDEKGKLGGNLRGEVKFNSISLSSGVETDGILSKNKYDAKISGDLFAGFKVNSGLEFKENKTSLKAGLSYSNPDETLKLKADTTGIEHSVKIEGNFKF